VAGEAAVSAPQCCWASGGDVIEIFDCSAAYSTRWWGVKEFHGVSADMSWYSMMTSQWRADYRVSLDMSQARRKDEPVTARSTYRIFRLSCGALGSAEAW